MSLTVGSLFSGIGGLDLGLERAGMTVIWQSEIDPYSSLVLKKHWPNVPNLGNVKDIDWSIVERPDLLCGGYPCQPFSTAGFRRGEDDERHLWPYVLDAIRVLRPRFVLCENVAGHLSLGFERVLADLAGVGFDAEWSLVSACSLGASHARERLFFLAYPTSLTGDGVPLHGIWPQPERGPQREPRGRDSGADGCGGRWPLHESPVCGGADEFPDHMDRLKGLGNAVVPAVAEFIGKQLLAAL